MKGPGEGADWMGRAEAESARGPPGPPGFALSGRGGGGGGAKAGQPLGGSGGVS